MLVTKVFYLQIKWIPHGIWDKIYIFNIIYLFKLACIHLAWFLVVRILTYLFKKKNENTKSIWNITAGIESCMSHQSCVQILNLFLAWYVFTRGDNIQLNILYYKGLLGNAFLKRKEIMGRRGHTWCGCAYTQMHTENYFKSFFLKLWSKSLGS